MAIKFKIRFAIGNRYGSSSIYTLREFCTSIVDRYSIKEAELESIIKLQLEEGISINKVLTIDRIK